MTVPTVSSGTPTQSSWANQVAAEVNGLIPVGAMWMWPTATPPAGWLLCNGQEVARTGTYQALFDAIGTTFGAGNGTTTFNVPNFANRFPMGPGASPAVGLGGTGGTKDAVVVSHSHTFTSGGQSQTHYHGLEAHSHYVDLPEVANHNHAGATGFVYAVSIGGPQNHRLAETVNTNETGPYITFSDVHAAGGHGHDGWSGGWGNAGGWQAANVDHTHSGTTSTNGESGTDKNLPPYLGINFIIKY